MLLSIFNGNATLKEKKTTALIWANTHILLLNHFYIINIIAKINIGFKL